MLESENHFQIKAIEPEISGKQSDTNSAKHPWNDNPDYGILYKSCTVDQTMLDPEYHLQSKAIEPVISGKQSDANSAKHPCVIWYCTYLSISEELIIQWVLF